MLASLLQAVWQSPVELRVPQRSIELRVDAQRGAQLIPRQRPPATWSQPGVLSTSRGKVVCSESQLDGYRNIRRTHPMSCQRHFWPPWLRGGSPQPLRPVATDIDTDVEEDLLQSDLSCWSAPVVLRAGGSPSTMRPGAISMPLSSVRSSPLTKSSLASAQAPMSMVQRCLQAVCVLARDKTQGRNDGNSAPTNHSTTDNALGRQTASVTRVKTLEPSGYRRRPSEQPNAHRGRSSSPGGI